MRKHFPGLCTENPLPFAAFSRNVSSMDKESTVEQRKRLTAQEAAALLSRLAGIPIAPRTMLGWAAKGRVPFHRVVGRITFDIEELQAFLAAGRGGPDLAAGQAGPGVMQ